MVLIEIILLSNYNQGQIVLTNTYIPKLLAQMLEPFLAQFYLTPEMGICSIESVMVPLLPQKNSKDFWAAADSDG